MGKDEREKVNAKTPPTTPRRPRLQYVAVGHDRGSLIRVPHRMDNNSHAMKDETKAKIAAVLAILLMIAGVIYSLGKW